MPIVLLCIGDERLRQASALALRGAGVQALLQPDTSALPDAVLTAQGVYLRATGALPPDPTGAELAEAVVAQLEGAGTVPAPLLELPMQEATLLFSDIRNFTRAAERLSVSEVAQVLAEYYRRACDIVQRQGGHHVKVMGDGLMAVFDDGTREVGEPHARRALRAALELSRHANEFQGWLDTWFAGRELPRFAIGVGVHSGEVMFGKLGMPGAEEVTPLGDAVNTASRLEALTKQLGWRIVASAATVRLAAGGIALGASCRLELRGRTEPVTVHEVLCSRATPKDNPGGYRLLHPLISGATATVYLATAPDGATVALKRLAPGAPHREAWQRRFRQEYEVLAALRSPHVVRVRHCATQGDDCFLVTEHLAGGSLRERIAAGCTQREALNLLAQAAAGVGALHALGFVHRDLKPEHLRFRANGELVLADCALARRVQDPLLLTRHGQFVGTPGYSSPEQLAREALDATSDFYALGLLLHELLTGRHPGAGASIEVLLARRRYAPAPRLPTECAALQQLLDRLLARDPRQRFASVAELSGALGALQRDTRRPDEERQPLQDLPAE